MMFAAYKYDENLKQLSFHHKYIKVIFQIVLFEINFNNQRLVEN